MEDLKTGLWKKTSKNGNTYYSGKIKIEEKEYYVNVFNNNFKKSDNSPDISLTLKPVEVKEDAPEGFAYVDEPLPF